MISKSEFDRNAQKLSAVDRNQLLTRVSNTIETAHFWERFYNLDAIQHTYEYDGTCVGVGRLILKMNDDVDLLRAWDLCTIMFVMEYIESMFHTLDIRSYDGVVLMRNGVPYVIVTKNTDMCSGESGVRTTKDFRSLLAEKSGSLLRFDIESVYDRVMFTRNDEKIIGICWKIIIFSLAMLIGTTYLQ
jgi:hypothetical protein